jgi:hypothetical protein
MVPFWDLSGDINDLTSKKIPLTAPQKVIAKLFRQQPVLGSIEQNHRNSMPFRAGCESGSTKDRLQLGCENGKLFLGEPLTLTHKAISSYTPPPKRKFSIILS